MITKQRTEDVVIILCHALPLIYSIFKFGINVFLAGLLALITCFFSIVFLDFLRVDDVANDKVFYFDYLSLLIIYIPYLVILLTLVYCE